MKKKFPFEDALENKLQHLPTPGEEASWQAMSQLLDKNEKRRPVFWRRRYFIFMLLVLLLLSGLWALLNNNETQAYKNKNATASVPQNSKDNSIAAADTKKDHSSTGNKTTLTAGDAPAYQVKPIGTTETKQTDQQAKNKNANTVKSQKTTNNIPVNGTIKTVIKDERLIANNESTSIINNKKRKPVTAFSYNKKLQPGKENNDITNSNRKGRSFSKGKQHVNIRGSVAADDHSEVKASSAEKDNASSNVSQNNKKQVHSKPKMNIKAGGNAGDATTTVVPAQQDTKKDMDAGNSITKPIDDAAVNDTVAAMVKPAVTVAVLKDSTDSSTKNKTEPVVKNSAKHQKKSHSYIWSAGIGMQQQIPVGNQKYTAYGFNGKNNIINNYVPAAYLRLERKGKWFTQLEFSYASPRMVSEFSYNRKTTINNVSTQISTTTTSLKKTYYHEIPLSFNYYIKSRWSVGAGVIYGWLHRAISEQQVTVKNIQSQQEQISTRIIPASYTDSFLYRSQFSWLLQTNYEWRRLTFGIRYAMDAQPYIKYTTPAGEINERRNWSLEFLLRLRLWKQGK